MIKILIIATSNFAIDGITNMIMNYYRYMDKSNMKIDFVTPNIVSDSLKNEIKNNGGVIHVLPMEMRNKHQIKYIMKLKKLIKKEGYDIVHAHGNSCTLFLEMYAAKLAKCKIRIAHSHNTTTRHPIVHFLFKPLFNITYTDGFACGEEAGKWLFGKKKFTVINNGNDLEKYRYSEEIRKKMREKYNLEGIKVIGHVGRFNYQKNHEFLIDVFEEINKLEENTKLVLIGEGSLKENIKKKVEEKKIEKQVIFVGESTEVEKWLQVMDIMVFPSRFEGFPLVLVEWQAAGLPCIISDAVTKDVKLTQLVDFISLEQTPKEWANKISKIKIKDRDSSEYIEEIKKKGYDIKENSKKLREIYMSLYNKVK